MMSRNAVRAALLACLATTAVAACSGSDGVASPGEGVFVPSPPPAAPPPPAPPPPPSPPTGPAASCPTGFTNVGLVTTNNAAVGTAGSYRNCQIPALITGSLLVPKTTGVVYSISGRVNVGEDTGPNPAAPIAGRTAGILSIEPGVVVFGSGTLDYIVVNRGSQINAVGTAAAPIVFTSRQSVEGSTTVDSIGQWGGLVILGRAPSSDGCPVGTIAPSILCDATVEGTAANYGGLTNTDNSGRLSYVRVQHSGFEVLPNQELNGITMAGVGNGTVVDHVQVHNSSDDGIELFGGTVNLSFIVLTGNDDDSYDLDSGYRGGTQHLLIVQRPNGGDRGFELSARGAKGTPTGSVFPFNTIPRIANATIVSRTGTVEVQLLNSGNGLRLVNSVVTRTGGTGACLDMDDADTTTAVPTWNSVFMSCATAFAADGNQQAETATAFNAGTNNTSAGTSTLTAVVAGAVPFVNGANETAVVGTTPIANATYSTTFTNTAYIGAVRPGDTWYRGWTCSALIGEEAC
jgi:7-cyano-7-deazaguanine synthase in queuosine biosynthesis